ncbi:hypothetical protein C8J57DRAFT_1245388 [Mycena rebaudengoi]|nr:hypothetical protein C8J57DRAFT_1245388 [Mycena rebaudengoi]
MSRASVTASERTNRRSPSGPQKTPETEAPRHTTRTTSDTLKMAGMLTKSREELYQLSTSSTPWATETHESVYAFLVAKGFAEERQNIQISIEKMALVLLHIAAQGGPATTTDAIRAVAVMLEHRRIDRALDDIRDELTTLSDLAAEAARRDGMRETGKASTSHTLLEAASVLTWMVDEQVDSLRTTMELLECATNQAAEAVDSTCGKGLLGLAPPPPPPSSRDRGRAAALVRSGDRRGGTTGAPPDASMRGGASQSSAARDGDTRSPCARSDDARVGDVDCQRNRRQSVNSDGGSGDGDRAGPARGGRFRRR